MKIASLAKYAGALSAGIALAACHGGVGQSVLGPSSPIASVALTPARSLLSLKQPDRRRSWMSQETKNGANSLLYISDQGTNDVYIFSLPKLTLSGTLTGFSQPAGECSDKKGNVWITNTNRTEIREYAHGAKSPIKSLNDPFGYPVGCAVDPKTGDLAVTNIFNFGGPGTVLVYQSPFSGAAEMVTNPAQAYYYFAGYDDDGNLYFDGTDSHLTFVLSEAPAGSSVGHTIGITGGTVYFPGMVQWDSKARDLILGDQGCENANESCIYTVSISGSSGSISNTTQLLNYSGSAACDVVQGALISTNRLAAGDYEHCGSTRSSANVWAFPKGGKPKVYVNNLSAPIGAALSR